MKQGKKRSINKAQLVRATAEMAKACRILIRYLWICPSKVKVAQSMEQAKVVPATFSVKDLDSVFNLKAFKNSSPSNRWPETKAKTFQRLIYP